METVHVVLEWYFLVSAIATPLTLAPARETAPRGILTRRPILLHSIFQRPYLGCSNKHLDMSVSPRSWSISHASSCTFLPALATLVTSFGPRLGGRIVGPWQWKAQFREPDTHYNSSSFLEA